MNLNLKGFSRLLQDMTAALQGSASTLIDVSAGSVLRAIFEANASVALWLQWLILQTLQMTRAATSVGANLDTWMNDFGLTRLPAIAAQGQITFSRFANTVTASVPAGAVVKTADGSQSFTVTADPTQSTWQASSNAYILPAGVGQITVPAACLTTGAGGNVVANAITVIASSLPGVDLVTNANAFGGGADAETDVAFRARFRNYLSSLSQATLLAVQSAVAGVQQNLNIFIQENTAPNGAASPGCFVITIDDGSGSPPATLLSAVANAVEAVRPIGTTFAVLPPQVLTVNVQLALQLSQAANAGQYVTSVQQLIAKYLDTLPIGAPASMTRIAQQAYSAGSAVQNVTGILLNGQPGDVAAAAGAVIKAGQVTVTTNGG
jgi:uncharacterized phage protein gp47/JayE